MITLINPSMQVAVDVTEAKAVAILGSKVNRKLKGDARWQLDDDNLVLFNGRIVTLQYRAQWYALLTHANHGD